MDRAIAYLPFDYSTWKTAGRLYEFASIDEAIAGKLRGNGVYSIGNRGLDFLIDGFERLNRRDPVFLVSFNADISLRETKSGPFFSGINVAKTLKMPLIAIADPAVTYDSGLSMGWYAGNIRHRRLVDDIARALDGFATAHGARLILFGGSAGGFATLNILPRLKCTASGLVNNPQTSVSAFWGYFVRRYLRHAFPAAGARLDHDIARAGIKPAILELRPNNPDHADEILRLHRLQRAALTYAGVPFDVTASAPKDGQVFYLQNRDDWHVGFHALPFMHTGHWQRVGRRSFACTERHAGILFGAWGPGHYAPPKPLIVDALAALRDGRPVGDFVAQADADDDGLDGSVFDPFA